MKSFLSPLARDPGRPRQSFRTPDAAEIAAGILGAGAASVRLARAGADALIARSCTGEATAHTGHAAGSRVLPGSRSLTVVTALIYELLDAQATTVRMATAFRGDPAWQEHIDQLQALRRKGRQMLAQLHPDGVG